MLRLLRVYGLYGLSFPKAEQPMRHPLPLSTPQMATMDRGDNRDNLHRANHLKAAWLMTN